MADRPAFHARNQSPRRQRPARLGELVWRLVKGIDVQTCVLRDYGEFGVEIQVLADSRPLAGWRHPNRESALTTAARIRADFEREGWKDGEKRSRG